MTRLNIIEMVKPPSQIGYGKSSEVFYHEESGEIPKQMRYRDCRKASVGNSSFIDRYDPTQSGSDHKVLQQQWNFCLMPFWALMGVFLYKRI
ncbi:hypothetical protein AKG39_07490 [Acetobacterium bakii]|uniref:Uncharacterized protein n=1 Tax=Acetobacterium bakii TaxID=52689 RepID=A0A0L6U119_9FIRM|nr:hypothetical protein AKG39_07490 [Acetobacterium bakii]